MSKLSRKIYSETFKLEVLRDYFSSGMSMISTSAIKTGTCVSMVSFHHNPKIQYVWI